MKKCISVLLAVIVVLSCCTVVYAASSTSKISVELQQIISKTDEGDRIPVLVWLNTKEYSVDEIHAMVREELGAQWFLDNWGMNPSIDAVHEYKSVYNRIASELETAENQTFINKSGLTEEDIVYVSTKAPMVQLKVDQQTIYRLDEMPEVQSITYDGSKPIESPTEASSPKPSDLYKERFVQKYVNQYNELLRYSEIYYHYDNSKNLDWVLVSCSLNGVSPMIYKAVIGNRFIRHNSYASPFSSGYCVFDVKSDEFKDVTYGVSNYPDFVHIFDETVIEGRLLGDLDRDNAITVIDVTMIQRCEANICDYPENDYYTLYSYEDGPKKFYSDFNRDGERDILDATSIQRYLANI